MIRGDYDQLEKENSFRKNLNTHVDCCRQTYLLDTRKDWHKACFDTATGHLVQRSSKMFPLLDICMSLHVRAWKLIGQSTEAWTRMAASLLEFYVP